LTLALVGAIGDGLGLRAWRWSQSETYKQSQTVIYKPSDSDSDILSR